MASAPRTVFLHIGLHKTGTTYLQNYLRANREEVRRQQMDFVGGPGEPSQALAVWDLQGRRYRDAEDKRIAGMWDSLVAAVSTSAFPSALISDERLSVSTLKQARKVVGSFPMAEIHVVVTARDIGRIVVSAWQEEIKNDTVWTWREFVDAIKDPSRAAKNPARAFWLRQDLAKICETWESVVPASRLHVLTVPPPGAAPDLLLERFTKLVGLDASAFTEQPAWTNETIGVAATEVIRRLNQRLGRRLNQRQYDKVVRRTLVPLVAHRTEAARFTLPAEELEWATAWADKTIAALQARGYPVVGDLDELRPRLTEGGRRPDDAGDDELLDASLDALALLAENYATSWWARRRPDAEPVAASNTLASRTRALVFRAQRKAGELADDNAVAAKAMETVLRRRDVARIKARDRLRT